MHCALTPRFFKEAGLCFFGQLLKKWHKLLNDKNIAFREKTLYSFFKNIFDRWKILRMRACCISLWRRSLLCIFLVMASAALEICPGFCSAPDLSEDQKIRLFGFLRDVLQEKGVVRLGPYLAEFSEAEALSPPIRMIDFVGLVGEINAHLEGECIAEESELQATYAAYKCTKRKALESPLVAHKIRKDGPVRGGVHKATKSRQRQGKGHRKGQGKGMFRARTHEVRAAQAMMGLSLDSSPQLLLNSPFSSPDRDEKRVRFSAMPVIFAEPIKRGIPVKIKVLYDHAKLRSD